MADMYCIDAYYPGFALPPPHPDGWVSIMSDRSRLYCEGYLARAEETTPRPAYRLRRTRDGVIIMQSTACDDPSLGMAAGYPSEEQCIRAAIMALRSARSRHNEPADPRVAAALAILDEVSDAG